VCIAWSGASLELAIESELDLEKERTGSEYFRSCSRLRYYETGCRHLSQNYLVGKAKLDGPGPPGSQRLLQYLYVFTYTLLPPIFLRLYLPLIFCSSLPEISSTSSCLHNPIIRPPSGRSCHPNILSHNYRRIRIMPTTLLTLPEFIFVEIGSWLDLKDAVSFTQVHCPFIYSVTILMLAMYHYFSDVCHFPCIESSTSILGAYPTAYQAREAIELAFRPQSSPMYPRKIMHYCIP